MLRNGKTVSAMAKNFEKSDKDLLPQILSALEKEAMGGGDKKRNQTAALLVRGKKSGYLE